MRYLKYIRLSLSASIFVLIGNVFTSCEEDIEITPPSHEKYETVDGNYLLLRNATGINNTSAISIFEDSKEAELSILLSKEASSSVEAQLTLNEEALAAYNEKNGTSYKMYPSSLVAFPSSVTISANATSATANVVLKPGENLVEKGELYAVPLSVKTQTEGISTSKGDDTYIYLVKYVGKIESITKGDGSIKTLCYVEVNDENILNAGEYYTTSGKPFFDIVNIFAANINYDANTGRVYVHCNDQVSYLLRNADKFIRPLQEKGIKVCMTILGNGDESGVANLSDVAAAEFAQELKHYIDIYGLDGIDFDDEYSNYADNPSPGFVKASPAAAARLAYECRLAFGPDKLITFYDWNLSPAGQVEGKDVGEFLNYSYYGKYGSYHPTAPQGLPKTQYGPYSINANFADPNGGGTFDVTTLKNVRENGYGVQVIYAIKSSLYDYTKMFSLIAQTLFDEEGVTWTHNYYSRTSDVPTKTIASNAYEKYIGTWKMVSNNCLYPYWDENNQYRWFDWGPSVEKEIIIEADEEGKSFKAYGFGNYQEELCKKYPITMDYNELLGTISIRTPQPMFTDDEGIEWSWGGNYYNNGFRYVTSSTTWYSGKKSNNSIKLESYYSNAMIEPLGIKDNIKYGPSRDTSKGKQYATGNLELTKQ